MKPPPDKTRPGKPAWTAQIVLLSIILVLLWLTGTGILYLLRFVSNRL